MILFRLFEKMVLFLSRWLRAFCFPIKLLIYKYSLKNKFTTNSCQRSPRKPRIIVSLTTTDYRVKNIYRVIASLRDQSIRADEICLFLSEKGYLADQGVPLRSIPDPIRKLDRGGKIRIVYTKNIGPYRKLIPVLKENYKEDCVIVTADDDTIYPYDWLESLYRGYLNFPNMISAHRNRLMRFQGPILASYMDWPRVTSRNYMNYARKVQKEIKEEFKKLFLFATGMGGILYSPRFFNELVFDEIFLKLAPKNDDIWFRFMTLINDVPVNIVSSRLNDDLDSWNLSGFKIGSLFRSNLAIAGRNNDAQIKNVVFYLQAKGLLNLRKHWVPELNGNT